MPCISLEHKLEQSLKSYSWYTILGRAYFWAPLFVLYFSSFVSLKQIFVLEAIYYAAVFFLEVPSGYFSDRMGRKPTLIISSISFCVSYFLFFLGGSFGMLATAQIFLALGFAFASGTDTALHYGLLLALKRENEYGDREAKLASRSLLSVGIAAVLGGLLAWLSEYRIAYGMSLLVSVISFILVLGMKDPEVENLQKETSISPLKQLKDVVEKLKDGNLRFLFMFTVFITVLNHIPYEFYQIYIDNILKQLNLSGQLSSISPLIIGMHTTLSMILASWFAGKSFKLKKRLGTKVVLLLLVCLQMGMIAILGINGSYIIVVLLMFRGLPGAISSPIVRAETTPKLRSGLRATYYSVQSLIGRISFALILVVFNIIPGDGYGHSLIAGVSFALLVLLFLAGKPYDAKNDQA